MAEKYSGVKFEVEFLKREAPNDKRIESMIHWAKVIGSLGLAPKNESGSAGNLSFRTNEGFIITGSGTDFENLNWEDFVEVVFCSEDKMKVCCNGFINPSSESILHYSIYEKRNDVNVIFHAHDRDALLSLDDEVITRNEKPYGSLSLVNEVLSVLGKNDYIMMKNHGVLAFGRNVLGAGELIVRKHEEARERLK